MADAIKTMQCELVDACDERFFGCIGMRIVVVVLVLVDGPIQ